MSNGISHPCRIRILRKGAAVRVNLARRIRCFRQHYDLLGRLNDLESENQECERYATGKTLSVRILQRVLLAVLKYRSRLRSKRFLFGLHAPKYVQYILGDVVRIDLQSGELFAEDTVVFSLGGFFRLPQPRHVRLAV